MSAPKQVRLAGSVLDRSRHVCAFFHRKEEEYRVLLPFIKEGFDQGDRAFHVVDSRHRAEHLRRLEEAGIAVAEAERKGQLEVRRWEDAYLRDGHFDQKRMLALIEEVLTGGKAQGFPLTRLVANMEWALEDRPGVGDILGTHPMVIIGGILQQNPFFVPPDEFLRELRERTGHNRAGVG